MYLDELKTQMNGIVGYIAFKDSTMVGSDFEPYPKEVMKILPIFLKIITEKKNPRRLILFGEKKNLSIHMCDKVVIGVILDRTANVLLLDVILRRILSKKEQLKEPVKVPSSLAEKIPYFDQPKERVLPNIPVYARNVLKFVDGKRTIKDIVTDSNLAIEIVLDIILAYRRSSVLHYRT